MEQIIDFFDEIKVEPVTYVAVFDEITGQILAVGPTHAHKEEKNKIQIDNEIAEMIIEGKINLFNCAIDLRDFSFELVERKLVSKIDDVLHRIVDSEWSPIDRPDIVISYDDDTSSFTFELTEEFGGTYVLPEKYQPVTKRKVLWDGDTSLNFYFTEYNDPNILYSKHSILLKNLIDSKITIDGVEFPEKFSIYTRRVLKNYILKRI
jgi:hypothetical protein